MKTPEPSNPPPPKSNLSNLYQPKKDVPASAAPNPKASYAQKRLSEIETPIERPVLKKATPNHNLRNALLVVAVVVGSILLGIFIAQKGWIGLFSAKNSQRLPPVRINYNDMQYYEGQNVTVGGYLIVPNDAVVCFSAWPTCKLWLDNDPTSPGLGLHEVQLNLGNGPNKITSAGVLHDWSGNELTLVENEAFRWVKIMVTGTVLFCKDGNCVIEGYSISVMP